MSIEFEYHRKTNSRAEYLRLMVVNIYKVLAELTDKRAHREARNGAQRVQGIHGVQDVHHVAQVVHSVHSPVHSIHRLEKVLAEITDRRTHQRVQGVQDVQDVHNVHSNHRLEPNYKQIPVEQKFVRPSNFKRGLRRKFFLFSDTHQVKEDEDLAQKPKNVSLKHLARGGSWVKTNMETYQKHGTFSLHPELSSGRLRRKQEPKRLRAGLSRGTGGALATPVFGRSVNPISTRGDTLSPPNTTSTPGFSDLSTALRLSTQHIMRDYFNKYLM